MNVDTVEPADEDEVNPDQIEKYGTLWPAGANAISIELACYRHHPKYTKHTRIKTPHSRAFHMLNAIKILWPERMPNGKRGHVITKWTIERVEAWCEDEYKVGDCNYQTWWGPSSTGKTTDSAVIVLVHWLSAPDETTVTVCSTTSKMLAKRIWGEILKYYNLLDGILPGTFVKSKMAILLDPKIMKHGLFGIAIQKGTIEEAVGDIVGVHDTYNVLVIDEQQATRKAATEAFDNLSTGVEAKFLGMGNPVSQLDALGQCSKPIKGWKSLKVGKPMTMRSRHWQTERGKTLFFSGLDSPGVDDPDKYPFLLNMTQINDLKKDPGENTPRFWSQRIGFIAPEGLVQTVLSEKFVTRFSMQDKPEWLNGEFVTVGAIDESFTLDGDRAVLEIAQVGEVVTGEQVVNFLDPIDIIPSVDVDDPDPLEFKMAKDVIKICKGHGIKPEHFGVDTSATQTAFASIVEKLWESPIYRCSFGVAASELPVSVEDETLAKDAYKNKVTELWYAMREFGKNNQIRGLHDKAIIEFCNRLVLTNGIKMFVEPKADYKARTGESPDIADACVIVLDIVRNVLDIHPGGGINPFEDEDDDAYSRDLDVDSDDDNYLHSSLDSSDDAGDSPEMQDFIRERQKQRAARIAGMHN